MQIETISGTNPPIAVVSGEDGWVRDRQAVLELIMTVRLETEADRMILDKRLFAEEFFHLSTGLAGELLQIFQNYRVKTAIYGEYTRYQSQPLRDFIRESNRGHDVFFVETKEEAADRLGAN